MLHILFKYTTYFHTCVHNTSSTVHIFVTLKTTKNTKSENKNSILCLVNLVWYLRDKFTSFFPQNKFVFNGVKNTIIAFHTTGNNTYKF